MLTIVQIFVIRIIITSKEKFDFLYQLDYQAIKFFVKPLVPVVYEIGKNCEVNKMTRNSCSSLKKAWNTVVEISQ